MKRLYESQPNLGLLVNLIIPYKVISFNPKFSTVSIIPGILIAAPDLTETSNGFSGFPSSLFIFFSSLTKLFLISAIISAGILLPPYS